MRPSSFAEKVELRLQQIRARKLQVQQASRANLGDLDLLDFVPAISPLWERPEHLAPIAALWERAVRGEEVRACVSVPPRHGKTELTLHAIAWVLRKHPEKTLGFLSYAADLAHSKSDAARRYALAAGVALSTTSNAKHEWRTTAGGGLLAAGVGGPLTGHGVDILAPDDPHKNREEAESPVYREKVWSWFRSTALTRVPPGGSVIATHTRWHDEDLIGQLLASNEGKTYSRWEHINLPAINDGTDPRRGDGEALWDKRPLPYLLQIQEELDGPNGYEWTSLFQGYPRPKSGKLFRDIHTYETLPEGCRFAVGVDGAYTEDTHADFSAAVVMAERSGVWYVVDLRHQQVEIEKFAAALSELAELYPTAKFFSRVGGQEKAVFRLLKRLDGVSIRTEQTVGDKYMNALGLSASWNAGKVLVPAKAPWLKRLTTEVCGFSGIGDKHDDIVDALVTAHMNLGGGRSRERREAAGHEFVNQ